MGSVISIHDYVMPWKEALTIDTEGSTLQVYVNERTREVEIVQMNDDGEAIRTVMSPEQSSLLIAAVACASKRS